jgi:hypothetical protein
LTVCPPRVLQAEYILQDSNAFLDVHVVHKRKQTP